MLSIETSNRPEMAKEFTTSVGASFPIVMDDQDVSGSLFGVHATPTNLTIDKTGRVIFKTVGFSPGREKTLAAQIEYLLKSAS